MQICQLFKFRGFYLKKKKKKIKHFPKTRRFFNILIFNIRIDNKNKKAPN